MLAGEKISNLGVRVGDAAACLKRGRGERRVESQEVVNRVNLGHYNYRACDCFVVIVEVEPRLSHAPTRHQHVLHASR